MNLQSAIDIFERCILVMIDDWDYPEGIAAVIKIVRLQAVVDVSF